MANLTTNISLDISLRRRRAANWKAIRSAWRDDAQSLIELALLMPLFILLLIGSAMFAQFAWASVLTSNAARAGASFGAQNPANAGNTAAIQAAAAADSVNLTALTSTSAVTCVCSNGATIGNCFTTALTDCPAPATITDYVTVNTTSTISAFGHSFTTNGKATMVVAP